MKVIDLKYGTLMPYTHMTQQKPPNLATTFQNPNKIVLVNMSKLNKWKKNTNTKFQSEVIARKIKELIYPKASDILNNNSNNKSFNHLIESSAYVAVFSCLGELIKNSQDAGATQAKLYINLNDNNNVTITYQDNGNGFDKKISLGKYMDTNASENQRSPSTKTELNTKGGCGKGLHWTAMIAQQNGGSLTLKNIIVNDKVCGAKLIFKSDYTPALLKFDDLGEIQGQHTKETGQNRYFLPLIDVKKRFRSSQTKTPEPELTPIEWHQQAHEIKQSKLSSRTRSTLTLKM